MKYNNINVIKNITTLKELSEYDEIIRHTCKTVINSEYYDDIVNDMYIKISKYMAKGTIINAGYVYMIMKTININMLNKEKHHEDIDYVSVIDEQTNSEDQYIGIDDKIRILDEFLATFLTQEEITMYKYYKLNSLKTTAIFYDKRLPTIRYQLKQITNKIKKNMDGKPLKTNIFKQK